MTEVAAEEVVDHGEDFWARAVVHRQRQHAGARCLAPLAENLHVRVTEAVDRLELVADEETLAISARAGDELDQLALQTVCVLELVDHDRAETQLFALADRYVVAQQIARSQLEIFEVERRLAVLSFLVRRGEPGQELLQQIAVGSGELVERSLLGPLTRLFVAGRAFPAQTQVAKVEDPVSACVLFEVDERPTRRLALSVSRTFVFREAARRLAELVDPHDEARPLAQLEDELPSGRSERLVDACEHPPQAVRAVDRQQPQTGRVVVRAEGGERLPERLPSQYAALALVEHAEARIDARRKRMRTQEPVAEAVDGGDPGSVERACQVGPSPLGEPLANPAAQLARGLLGVRDDEDRLDVDSFVADRAGKPLDEHFRLSGPRAGRDEDEAACVDRLLLFRVQVHARLTRHIGASSHQVGQSPPFGSCVTSPSRMRSTIPTASSRAPSTFPQNSSSPR